MVRNRREKPDADTPALDGADAPIQSLSEDRLGRRSFAEALAAEVMAAPVARGYVMGLTGAWGTDKTSILNMAVDAWATGPSSCTSTPGCSRAPRPSSARFSRK